MLLWLCGTRFRRSAASLRMTVSDEDKRVGGGRTLALRYMLADFSDQLWNFGPIAIAASGIQEIEKMPRLVRRLMLSLMLVDKSR